MADKLTPAQTAILDKVALHGYVVGQAVITDDDPLSVSLSSARAHVKKAFLTEGDGRRFELAEDEPVADSPAAYADKALSVLSGLAARLRAGQVNGEYEALPKKKLDAQQIRTKRKARQKHRVARAQRRINRKRAA